MDCLSPTTRIASPPTSFWVVSQNDADDLHTALMFYIFVSSPNE